MGSIIFTLLFLKDQIPHKVGIIAHKTDLSNFFRGEVINSKNPTTSTLRSTRRTNHKPQKC